MLLATPPMVGPDLGAACLTQRTSFTTSSVSGGPNSGYQYVASASSSAGGTATDFIYVVNPDLENSASNFCQANCGQSGFISANNLRTNVHRHEAGTTESHYKYYADAQNNPNNNVGIGVETEVGTPGMSTAAFTTQVTNTVNSRVNAINSATAVQPLGANYDASGNWQGNINFPNAQGNYQPCP